MKKLNYFFVIIFVCLFWKPIYPQNDSIVAITELTRLNDYYGYRINMTVKQEGSIISLPNQEIQISLAELKRISPLINKRVRFYVVRFIVQHEFAHQMQYYKYGNDPKYMNDDPISKMLIETQADIMAGHMLFEMSPEIMVYQQSHPQMIDSIFNELFRISHDMGIRENTLGSHPSKHDRLIAVTLGMTNGLGYIFDRWVKQRGLISQDFAEMMDKHFYFIDLDKKEDMLSWSYRQAKKIVNYDRKISSEIVLTTPADKRQFFYPDKSNPYVDYNLTYKNIGNKSIDVDIEVYVAHVKLAYPDSLGDYRKINVDHHKFTLLPGESKILKGRLSWLKRDYSLTGNFELSESYMPRIVYPGSKFNQDAIYSCTYSNDNPSVIYQDSLKGYHFFESEDFLDFPVFFNLLLNAYSLNENISSGIGAIHSNLPDEIVYASSIQFKEGSYTSVNINSQQKISAIEVFFVDFYSDENKLNATFSEIEKILDKELKSYEKETGQENGNLYLYYTGKNFDVSIEIYKNEASKEYSIKMELLF